MATDPALPHPGHRRRQHVHPRSDVPALRAGKDRDGGGAAGTRGGRGGPRHAALGRLAVHLPLHRPHGHRSDVLTRCTLEMQLITDS